MDQIESDSDGRFMHGLDIRDGGDDLTILPHAFENIVYVDEGSLSFSGHTFDFDGFTDGEFVIESESLPLEYARYNKIIVNEDGSVVGITGEGEDADGVLISTTEETTNREAIAAQESSETKLTKEAQQEVDDIEDELKATMKEKQAQKIAYDLTWALLDLTMQEFIFPEIDEMCKEDFDASEPPSDKPKDESSGDGGSGSPGGDQGGSSGDGGDGGPGGGDGEPCDETIFHAELFEDDEGYHVSYTIRSCEGLINYNVYLSGDEPDYLVDFGFVAEGQEISENLLIDILPPDTYHNVCIQAGEIDQCF